ncbi:NACHT domain-containing protein [Yinghuangia soli]|uniref:NACHT domain-containing protein n=1 Tax=Yinghuangia soli TaxID=2908204 RepID=A0AA41U015_9ACTN|nr:NACHT domain-containing protein [Yinghuangia soli]MCF2529363.1 NACHT domain-containing protein [Yinghuangia soli]
MPDPATVRVATAAAQVLGRQLYKRHKLAQRAVDKDAFDKIVDKLARDSDDLRAAEFRGLPDNEWNAAAECLKAAFELVGEMDARVPLSQAMNPVRLAEWLRNLAPGLPAAYSLVPAARGAYERLSVLACTAVVEFVRSHPEFPLQADIEQLERLERIERHVGPPDDEALAAFERRYLAAVDRQLNRLELFGVTLRDRDFHYPMSTAYISVAAQSEDTTRLRTSSAGPLRIEEVLGDRRRILLRGEAGSGKTTLMQRLALWAAQDTFPPDLRDWAGTVPFFLPLRHFSFTGAPPRPEDFLDYTSPLLRDEMPVHWVRDLLAAGRALVLIDGVDELPVDQRERMRREWLRELCAMYPRSRFVVSSRPSAIGESWLGEYGFGCASLQPMNLSDQREFVAHWHSAVAEYQKTPREPDVEADLIAKLTTRRHLRRLASNPLLCALICALHHERRMQLPEDRIKLYEAALEMLVVRRDSVRGVRAAEGVVVGEREQEILLQKLAYWMIRNGLTEASREDALERVTGYLAGTAHGTDDPEAVLRHLIVRSGVLREPGPGRVDFVHRTFQEFLAAREALDAGDINILLKNCDKDDQWREVVVMAVGLGREHERNRLIRGLLKRAADVKNRHAALTLIAADAIGNAPAIDPLLRSEVTEQAGRLLPPRSSETANALAALGESVLDLMPAYDGSIEGTMQHVTALLLMVGGEAAIDLLGSYARQYPWSAPPPHDTATLARLFWDSSSTDQAAYITRVLRHVPYPELQLVTATTPLELRLYAQIPGIQWLNLDHSIPLSPGCLEGFHDLNSLVLHGPEVESDDYPGDLLEALRDCPKLRRLHFLGSLRRARLVVDGELFELELMDQNDAALPERVTLTYPRLPPEIVVRGHGVRLLYTGRTPRRRA